MCATKGGIISRYAQLRRFQAPCQNGQIKKVKPRAELDSSAGVQLEGQTDTDASDYPPALSELLPRPCCPLFSRRGHTQCPHCLNE